MAVQLRGLLSGDDASKEQIERQVLNIWDKIYKTWFAKVSSLEYWFLSLDAATVHWRGICYGDVAVCVCVCHVDVLCPNDRVDHHATFTRL